MNIALCYKGAFKLNYIKNNKIDDLYIKDYKDALQNHQLMLWDFLGKNNDIHFINSTYFINEEFHKIINLYFTNIFQLFQNTLNLNQNSWQAQLNHYLNIINCIKNNKKNGINYDYYIFTRPDIKFSKEYNKQKIDFNKFNITVKHKSENCDDNYWIFPDKYFYNFEKSIIEMIKDYKITHEINQYLLKNNVEINYIDNLIETHMGNTIFSFIR